MKLTKRDVLAVLAGLKVDGVEPLQEGYIQDVVIEWHGDVPYVGVHVDETWRDQPVTPEALEAIRARVLSIPGVGAAKAIPRSRQRFEEALAMQRKRRREQQVLRPGAQSVTVAVMSGKGGVGKSTVAAYLARALAWMGLQPALLDCDIYGFSLPRILGIEELPKVQEGRLVPPRAYGIPVMSMDFFVTQNRPVAWRGPLLGKAIRQMTEQTLWQDPDVFVLDLPPGTGDVALDVHAYFPQSAALVVTTPDEMAATVAVRAGRLAADAGHPILGVVETMAYLVCPGDGRRLYPLGRGGGDRVAQALSAPVLARIPWVLPVGEEEEGEADASHPEEDGRQEALLAYRHLAEAVWQRVRPDARTAPAQDG